MIIYGGENGQPFVEIKEWSDILEEPGFEGQVDHKQIKLKQIIGKYSLPEKHPCGLKSCRTPHNRGYLVLAENGVKTNVGNICGKGIFGVEFQQLQDIFNRDMNAQRYREDLTAAKNQLGLLEQRVRVLSDGDNKGDWCYKKMHSQLTRLFPEFIEKKLIARAKRSDAIISSELAMTEEEKELAMETGGKSEFKTETLCVIGGIGSVITYKKLKTILDVRLGTDVEAFKEVDISQSDYKTLQHWHRWHNKTDRWLREANDIIDDCNRFLLQSNIENIRNFKTYL